MYVEKLFHFYQIKLFYTNGKGVQLYQVQNKISQLHDLILCATHVHSVQKLNINAVAWIYTLH